jgi:hypothetical protein
MNACLPESDLQQLGTDLLADFGRRIASIPQELCAPFSEEAGRLETELLMIYKFVALCVRKEENLAVIASKWALMVKICDEAAKELGVLSERHPQCGADAYYDQILDLRAKCQRLQKIHS